MVKVDKEEAYELDKKIVGDWYKFYSHTLRDPNAVFLTRREAYLLATTLSENFMDFSPQRQTYMGLRIVTTISPMSPKVGWLLENADDDDENDASKAGPFGGNSNEPS